MYVIVENNAMIHENQANTIKFSKILSIRGQWWRCNVSHHFSKWAEKKKKEEVGVTER